MKIHFVGVSGTGMGALALLFKQAGHEITGSDASFDPPIGPALEAGGVICLKGYDAKHLDPAPDLVVVGNAIRRENPEASWVRDHGLVATSMSRALRDHFLKGRRPLIVTGTHGKTTTSAMCAWILSRAELEPGWFIGGLPKNLPGGAAIGGSKRKLASSSGEVRNPGAAPPFVVEGDEYDAVYWHKKPKFLDYVGANDAVGDVIILTSVEHDHVDIYPTPESYAAEFAEMLTKVPKNGLIVCDARDKNARALVLEHAKRTPDARISWYALEADDTGDVTPTWLGAPCPVDDAGMQPFDLFVGGASCGRFSLRVPGAHNIRNAIGAIAATTEGFGVAITTARSAMTQFEGVRRRQDLLGTPRGIFVYDDFAHHPTAVDETLRALRSKHPKGALFAIFEPRSATACRALHQKEYVGAFGAADHVILAPLGRSNVPEGERLDIAKLAEDIGARAFAATSSEEIVERVAKKSRSGDVVALLSNGAFGGLHAKVLGALESADPA